jgi:uncharacterized protein YhaN
MTSQKPEIKLEESVYHTRFSTALSNSNKVASMISENLQTQYREALDETLNQLQSVTLLIAQIEAKMDDVRDSMNSLCQVVEEIITSNHPE